MKTVFIDGSAGTTGIQIHERLSMRNDIQLHILPESVRKDPSARKVALNTADIAFLCLPDQAAVEAVELCDNPELVIIDTSTAHRCAEGWAYGFAEIPAADGVLREKIAESKRIANPGCHASGFIALIAPLVKAGLIDQNVMLSCVSVTGYSGGGKKMIAEYEAEPEGYDGPRQYGLTQMHKHIPEMMRYSMIEHAPVFMPNVADFRQGMEVSVPLFVSQMKGGDIDAVREVYREIYQGPIVHFDPEADEDGFLSASKYAGYDDMEITVNGNSERIVLTARYDNLGKGACGAAIQNMNLVLGIDETTGLNLKTI